MSTIKYWVWLSSKEGVNAAAKGNLLRRFISPEHIYFAREEELRGVDGVGDRELAALRNKDMDRANTILSECEQINCRVLTIQDAEYPERLRNIYDPPVVLYIRGRLPAIDAEPVVAIVGTRSCTPYGLRNAESVGYGLARRGFVITTGLARGVDTAAVKGALRGGGRVIGLLGGGIDVVYPRENAELFEDVLNAGALISEYPPGTESRGSHFPVRNRIISGISLGVAVIEAPAKSGALITASSALEQGRDVFAMPGNVDSESSGGANQLLREGAIPLTSADDIAREYYALFPEKITMTRPDIPLTQRAERRLIKTGLPRQTSAKNGGGAENDNKEIDNPEPEVYISREREKVIAERAAALTDDTAKAVFAAVAELGEGGAYIDDIIRESGLTAAETLSTLTLLELNGDIVDMGGGFFGI